MSRCVVRVRLLFVRPARSTLAVRFLLPGRGRTTHPRLRMGPMDRNSDRARLLVNGLGLSALAWALRNWWRRVPSTG